MGVFVGLEPHQPDAVVGTPAGAALAESSSEFPASALLNDRAFDTWRSAGLTPAQTRFLARFATKRPRPGLVSLRGCNLSNSGGARVIVARPGGWATRGGVSFAGGSIIDFVYSPLTIAAPTSFTFEIVFRPESMATGAGSSVFAFFGNSISLPAATDRLFSITYTAGTVIADVYRYSATPTSVSIAGISAGRPHVVKLRVDNVTGITTLAVDGVLNSAATISAHSAQSNQALVVGRYTRCEIGYARLCSRALSDAELAMVPETLVGGEPNVVLSWPFTNGSGTTVTDEVGAYNGTINGTFAWGAHLRNPLPLYDSGLVDWRGRWRRRRRILFRGTDLAQTAATLNRTRHVGGTFWLRINPSMLSVGVAQSVIQFGPAASTQDWIIQVASTGALRFIAHRGASASAVSTAGSIADGNWHEVAFYINGTANTATLIVDGVLVSGACPAFTAAGSQRLLIGAASNGRCEISGDLVIWSRMITAAEIAARRWGWWHHGDDPAIRHLYRLGEASGNFTDLAGGATLTVTGSPSHNIRSWDDDAGVTDTTSRRSTPPHLLPTDLHLDTGEEDQEVGEISVELHDPAHPSGYVALGAIDVIEGLRPEKGARPGSEEGIEVGAIEWSESGVPSIDSDAPRASLELNLSLLQEHERSRIRQALERTRRKVVITREDLDPTSPWRTDHAVYGIVERSGTTSDRSGTAFAFERKVAIMEIPSPHSAPEETVW